MDVDIYSTPKTSLDVELHSDHSVVKKSNVVINLLRWMLLPIAVFCSWWCIVFITIIVATEFSLTNSSNERIFVAVMAALSASMVIFVGYFIAPAYKRLVSLAVYTIGLFCAVVLIAVQLESIFAGRISLLTYCSVFAIIFGTISVIYIFYSERYKRPLVN